MNLYGNGLFLQKAKEIGMLNEKVYMSPRNGALCVCIPLYLKEVTKELRGGYTITLEAKEEIPTAYILDIGKQKMFVNAEFVHNELIYVDEL